MSLQSLLRATLALAVALTVACSEPPTTRFNFDADTPTDMVESDGGCSLPNITCGRSCVNPADDPRNCGGCGISCGGTRVCINGRCDNECPSSPARQTRCNERCTDTNVDRANCGACDRACPEGQVCSAGSCQIECGPQYSSCTTASPDGGVRDGGARDATSAGPSVRCADLRTDDQHCGACNNACALGNTCIDGTCELRCPMGQTDCSGRCVELMTSQTDCGACGTRCVGLQRCTRGSCTGMTCPAGTTECSGTCADLTANVQHCGMCGAACPSPQFCRAGRCVLECPTARTACSNRCVDAMTDRTNCGMCGVVCPGGNECVMGMCRLTCPMGTTNCMGRCVDLSSERVNCGACGNTCGAGQLCAGGSCAPRCADVQTNCLGVCVNTSVDPNNCGACGVMCGPGYACSGGFCRALVGTDIAGCASPSVQCGPVCSDIRNDNDNCGRCGNRCTADRLCAVGMCVAPCAAGQTRCGATCVNVLNDRTNCGRCGNACTGTLSCVSGACTMDPTFRIDTLSTTMAMCRVIDHTLVTGDDRGGIAVSSSRVFYSGDTATARAALTDLTDLTAIGAPHDTMLSDLASGEVYVLLNAMGVQLSYFTAVFPITITQLGVLDGATGVLTATRIPLSAPVEIRSGAGIFSGRGRAYIFSPGVGSTAGTWTQIRLPSGMVTVLRTMAPTPLHTFCGSWAFWGVAEFFGAEPYAVFVENSTRVVRYRIRDAMITPMTTGASLGDMCSMTYSPMNNRWYFHYEGTGFAGGTSESIGYCPGTSSTP